MVKQMSSRSNSQKYFEYFLIIVRLFFPGHRTWIVKTLVLTGLGMVSIPIWEPFVAAILENKYGIQIPPVGAGGWALILIGVLLYIFNVLDERKMFPSDLYRNSHKNNQKILFSKKTFRESLRVHVSPRKDIYTIKIKDSDFDGNVSINISVAEEGITLCAYDTENSPMYLLTSFPSRLLLPLPISEGKRWEETGESNAGFQLKSVSEITCGNESLTVSAGCFDCVKVETIFENLGNYTGPHIIKKIVWWAHGVGPVKLLTEFNGGEQCSGELYEYDLAKEDGFWPMNINNTWVYEWELGRPNNSKNVSDPSLEVRTTILN